MSCYKDFVSYEQRYIAREYNFYKTIPVFLLERNFRHIFILNKKKSERRVIVKL